MNSILNSRQARQIRRTVPARLLPVGLALSSAFSALRAEASVTKTPFHASPPKPGWLDGNDADPLPRPVTPARSRRELFFIDAAVANPGAFWLAAPLDATVVCIPIGVDSWHFMAQEAERFRGLGALHIICHGEPGALTLNGRRYTAAELDSRPEALRALGRALTKNGDILLYGCDTGEGVAGAKLVTTLAEFTGADVAASSNPTGGRPGADWSLEIVRGEIETVPLAPHGYEHELATLTVTTGLDTGADATFGANQAADLADGSGLSLREAVHWASNGDTVNFNIGMTVALSTIDAGDSLLLINKNLTIDGDSNNDGTAEVTLDGQYKGRVLEIAVGRSVVLDGLIITQGLVAGRGGNGGFGAGASLAGGLSIAGTVTLRNVAVTANVAAGGGGGGGVTGAFYGGAGGGGGALAPGLGGHGGSTGPGTGTLGGGPGVPGVGGYGGGYDAVHMGGRGGSSVGGTGGGGVAYYSNGGNGGAVISGGLSIGGGGGGAGWDKVGGAGGAAAGGIYNASTGIINVIGTSIISNNLGAGGGGGGGGGFTSNGSNGGAGGQGVGAVWNKGIFNITSANFSALAGNSGGSGAGGPALSGGSTGVSPAGVANIFNDGGTLNSNFVANLTPTFVDAGSGTLNINQNASATDLTGLLHVSDTDSGQTETWSEDSPPAHGTLSIVGATAASGSTNITPGGTITYTPTDDYVGSDSFSVQVSDGTGTSVRTILVTVTDVTAPTVTSVVRKTPSQQTVTTDMVVFAVTFSEDVTGVTPAWFVLARVNGSTVTGTVASVSGGPRIYDVSVNLTGGSGEFRLDVTTP